MKPSKFLPVILSILCLALIGCNAAVSPELTATATENAAIGLVETGPTQAPQQIGATTAAATTAAATATTTATPTPTLTPFPTNTPEPTFPPPEPTIPPVTPSPTLTPSVTPTLYPDAWVAGLLWDQEENIIYVGSSSGVVYDSRIRYEPVSAEVANEIAAMTPGALVVMYGDYTPLDVRDGIIAVERVEQVSLPYGEETPLSAVYAHPDYNFSFAYPEGWTISAENDNTKLTLTNRAPESDIYFGPGIEYSDPTAIWLVMNIEKMPLEAYVQYQMERENIGEGVDDDQYRKVIVTEREFNGLPVTQIDIETIIWRTYRYYVVALDSETVLVFGFSIEDSDFVERMITTLSINVP